MSPEWIRSELKRLGKSQRALAVALGIDPSGVNRLLAGDRQLKAAELEIIKKFLDHREERPRPKLAVTPSAFSVQTGQSGGPEDLLKVLGMAEGGPDGWNLWNGDVIETMRRPDNLIGVPAAYAVYVSGTSMEPRYHPGEKVHVHPGRPPQPGNYVLVQRKPLHDGEPPLAVVKRLVRRSASKVTLEQFNPKKQFDVPAGDIVSIHKIVGSSED